MGADDIDQFVEHRQAISRMYVEAADLLTSHDEAAAREFLGRALALKAECETKVRDD